MTTLPEWSASIAVRALEHDPAYVPEDELEKLGPVREAELGFEEYPDEDEGRV